MYTCDKRRSKAAVIAEMAPAFARNSNVIDFETHGFRTEDDDEWTETREDTQLCTARALTLLEWLANRPEREIAVVTHNSFLRHLQLGFGDMMQSADKDMLREKLKVGEIRTVLLGSTGAR
jgi:broad specificity phosphatase PhoE